MATALFWSAIAMVGAAHQSIACIGRPTAYPTITHETSVSITYTGALAHGTAVATIRFPPGFTGICGTSLVLRPNTLVLTLQHAQNPQAALTYGFSHTFWFTGDSFVTDVYGGPGQVVDVSIPFMLPANQTGKPAGLYQQHFNLRLLNRTNGGLYHESHINLSATVASSCTLPHPSLSALDFTPAIVNGTIPTAFQRSFSFANAGCNGPARLTLAAQPLTKPGGGTPIHFSASAVLGGTAASLDTQATASSFTNAISAPDSGSVPVTVTVLPTAAPLPAGIYSSYLRVSLEPAQ